LKLGLEFGVCAKKELVEYDEVGLGVGLVEETGVVKGN